MEDYRNYNDDHWNQDGTGIAIIVLVPLYFDQLPEGAVDPEVEASFSEATAPISLFLKERKRSMNLDDR